MTMAPREIGMRYSNRDSRWGGGGGPGPMRTHKQRDD